jgi:hypothetical protein
MFVQKGRLYVEVSWAAGFSLGLHGQVHRGTFRLTLGFLWFSLTVGVMPRAVVLTLHRQHDVEDYPQDSAQAGP